MQNTNLQNQFSCAVCLTVLLAASTSAFAFDWTDGFDLSKKEGDRYYVGFAPYTHHYHRSTEHKYVWLIGLERERTDSAIAGITFFSNSFGQSSTYIYPWGQVYRELFGHPPLYAKLSAGLLYGYRIPFEDKVPLNYNGFSPGAVATIGWEFEGRKQVDLNFLGTSAVMLKLTLPLN